MEYPKIVWDHIQGYQCIQCASNRFRLVSDQYGYIAKFTTRETAVSYANHEFLF